MGVSRLSFVFFFFLALSPALCLASAEEGIIDKPGALKWKIIAIFLILVSSTAGILIPVLGKRWPILSPERDFFFVLKAFAAGVILATAMIHILPLAFEKLTGEGLNISPWKDFPFAGFVAMLSAILTLIIDTTASGYFHRSYLKKPQPEEAISNDVESAGQSHGHSRPFDVKTKESELIRHRIISQVRNLL